MIEISKRNGIWELYVNGALYHYHQELEGVIVYLHRHIDEIQEELKQDEEDTNANP